MQLTDAEIREILRRRKIEKMRRQRRRRRIMFVVAVIVIAAIFILVKVLGGNGSGKDSSKDGKKAAAGNGVVIFIDPGHGGMDSGSDDDNDRYEKDDTLRLSLSVKDHLEAMGYTVEMSRTEDEMVDRTARGEMANKCGAQLFVSIHRNKAATDGSGVEGFIPKSDDAQSRQLGENMIRFLGRVGFKERTIRAGTLNSPDEDYEELAVTTMPSVLIEIGFLSSTYDNELFDTKLDSNAQAIADAVHYTYLQINDPDKAIEFNAQIEATDNAVAQITENTIKVLDETSVIAEEELERVDDGSGGIDPEA